MKIGKYPVKRTYKISRLIADVFSLALTVLIFSATSSFLDSYEGLLASMNVSAENVASVIQQNDPSLVWRHWLALIFPAAAVIIFAVYLILTLKSHKMSRVNLTKLTAQPVYDMYAFCAALCKIPALLAVFDLMYIAHHKLLGDTQTSWFSIQIILDVLIIAVIIRFCKHRIDTITAPRTPSDTGVQRVKAVAVKKAAEAPSEPDKEKIITSEEQE